MSKWIRKGDKVIVIAGNEKGRVGEVLSKLKDRVIVKGVNLRKKHMKRTSQTQAAQIIEIEMSLHVSNVSFVSASEKPIKAKVKLTENGKQLIYFENDKEVVLRDIKKVK